MAIHKQGIMYLNELRLGLVEPGIQEDDFEFDEPIFDFAEASPREHVPMVDTEKHAQASLEHLPVELQAQIFAQLPAREVCRLSNMSKALKANIDKNAATILHHPMQCNRRRIIADYDSMVGFAGIEFDEAVQRYYNHYGPDSCSDLLTDSTTEASLSSFIREWILANHAVIPPADIKDITLSLFKVTSAIVEQCLEPHTAIYLFHPCLTRTMAIFNTHGYYKNARCHDLFNAIRRLYLVDRWNELDSWKADVTSSSPDEDDMHLRDWTNRSAGYSLAKQYANGINFEGPMLSLQLGLPDVKEDAICAYRVRDGVLWRLIRDALKYRDKELTVLQKAAVLEELFIW